MSATAATPTAIPLDDYAPIIGKPELDELRALSMSLQGHSVQMVSSTAVGGGVAEILTRLVPILQELGLSIRWDVITGGNDFFGITKAFHNALHGGPYLLPPESFETFLAYNQQNLSRFSMDGEFTVIHDPQPVALIRGEAITPAIGFGAAISTCRTPIPQFGDSSNLGWENTMRRFFRHRSLPKNCKSRSTCSSLVSIRSRKKIRNFRLRPCVKS